jgi:long-subunit acyl-CoA synthetase (AMP-forming)
MISKLGVFISLVSLLQQLNTHTLFKLPLGIMAAGAINVVRGSRSSAEELLLIYNHSDRLTEFPSLSVFIFYSS